MKVDGTLGLQNCNLSQLKKLQVVSVRIDYSLFFEVLVLASNRLITINMLS